MQATVHEVCELSAVTAGGRELAVWRSAAPGAVANGRIAIVAPGFARRMRHMAAAARYLSANGFVVYRCDYVDHVGLSEGEILGFTLTGMSDSLQALVERIAEDEPDASIVVVAASLAARACFRLATTEPRLSGVLGIFGVVNTRFTLRRVFGAEAVDRPLEHVPPDELMTFERKRISSARFLSDFHANDWSGLDGTRHDLERVACPVVNFCGSADDWIDLAEVKDVFASAAGRARVVELPFVEHDLAKNPVAGQALMREVTRHALRCADGSDPADVAEPSFADIAAQIPYERGVEAHRLEHPDPLATTPNARSVHR